MMAGNRPMLPDAPLPPSLPDVLAQLTRAGGPGEAAWVTLQAALRGTAAQSGAAYLPGTHGVSADEGRLAAAVPQDTSFRWPDILPKEGEWPADTLVLPLPGADPLLGVLAFRFPEEQPVTAQERAFLQTLALACALACRDTCQPETLPEMQAARFDRLVEASPIGIAVGDLGGQLIQVNDAYLSMLDFTRADFEAGRIDWAHLTPPEYLPGDAAAFERAFQHGSSGFYEKEMLTRQGERLPVGVNLVRYHDTQAQYVVGYVQDLRPQRAHERSLRAYSSTLEQQLQQGSELLAQHVLAQDAFVAFVEATGTETDPLMLARRAAEVLHGTLPQTSVMYFELEGGLWKARVGSPDVPDSALKELQRGLPQDTRSFEVALGSPEVVFTDTWSGGASPLEAAHIYGAAALLALSRRDPPGLLVVGTRGPHAWTEGERATVRGVGRSLGLALERAAATQRLEWQNTELEARTRALEGFTELTRDLALDGDVYALIRRAQELAQSLLPQGFAVYYEPEHDPLRGRLWRLKSQVGSVGNPDLQALLDAGLPFDDTQNLLIPWRSRQPYYQDAYDARQDNLGSDTVGQLQSTATIPMRVAGQVRGIFAFGLNQGRHWRRADKAVLESVAGSLGSAIERVEKTRRLEAERAGLDAFARFTEAVADETDVYALARRAVDVLRATLGPVSVAYFDLEGGHWRAKVCSPGLPRALWDGFQRGVPVQTPSFARAAEARQTLFVSDWAPGREGLAEAAGDGTSGDGAAQDSVADYGAAEYGAAAFHPYFVHGEARGLLAVGTAHAVSWTEREQAIIRATSRSLGLALERSAAAQHLRQQNAELAARTRALEAFAELTRDIDFQSDPYALINRAQQVMLSLTPPGYADYFEVQGGVWHSKARTGERRNPQLQATVDAGLPYDTLNTLRVPYETRQPTYQDTYDQRSDSLGEQVQQVGATAALPVRVDGDVHGVLALGLFEAHTWSASDRAVLETVVRALELALEGAQGVMALRRRTQELERSNQELEQFAYVASHDLQEPLRTVTSFTQLLLRRLDVTDPRAERYAQFIMEGTGRMSRLIQDLLEFSRVATQGREPTRVNTARVLEQVVHDLSVQLGTGRVQVGDLPDVQADGTQVRQLFQNLIGNALKFTSPERPALVQVSARREGHLIEFRVQDNGIGIAPEHFGRIFTIFQRLHHRGEYEGSGIGLSIARRIVERHGGTLWLDSLPGQGTTFFFTLLEAKA
ncbi:ATP-binding protein [Deinococcus fonticola]|uniref:ATP-binding protein n=1 Tax=Deinococcus fonticola TaxID=2528713 RepID=UPI00107537D0|nr:ATP-binding protein [Deinococcus fonticola]